MSILLTGATGFIGSHFDFHMYDIIPVVREGDNSKFNRAFEIDGIHSNTDWSGAFEGVDSIIHLGGLAHNKSFSESEYHEVNVLGTLRLATQAAAAGVKRFVFVSSIGVNGPLTFEQKFTSTDLPCPDGLYAHSKYNAEVGLNKIANQTGIELVVVRPTLVYGDSAPGNFNKLVKLIKILPILPFGLSKNKRCFISVQNLVDLLITCSNHPAASGHIFLAAEGDAISIKEFSNLLVKCLGKKRFQVPIPVSALFLLGKLLGKSRMVEQLYGNLDVDCSELVEVLGWKPPFTPFQSMSLVKG